MGGSLFVRAQLTQTICRGDVDLGVGLDVEEEPARWRIGIGGRLALDDLLDDFKQMAAAEEAEA